jgi:hypothetical protein
MNAKIWFSLKLYETKYIINEKKCNIIVNLG